MSDPPRVRILWTETAKQCLKKLPPKVRRGLLEKADELYNCGDPRTVHKPLVGPLAGHYRIVYSRYRAVFRVDEQRSDRGVVLTLTVLFIAAGIRRQHSKEDVYRVAKKIVDLGLADPPDKPDPGR